MKPVAAPFLPSPPAMAVSSHLHSPCVLFSHGAIVARLAAIEEMAGMSMLCSDKTGTLTMNKMVVQDDCPVFMDGIDRDSVLLHAALAAKVSKCGSSWLGTLHTHYSER